MNDSTIPAADSYERRRIPVLDALQDVSVHNPKCFANDFLHHLHCLISS